MYDFSNANEQFAFEFREEHLRNYSFLIDFSAAVARLKSSSL